VLARFLVERVHPIPAAVLLHLDPLAIVLLVFDRDVVAALALLTRKGHFDPLFVFGHVRFLSSPTILRADLLRR